jgi:hypothetical protein
MRTITALLATLSVAGLVTGAAVAKTSRVSCFKHHGWQVAGTNGKGEARPKHWKYVHTQIVVGKSPGAFVHGSWWAVAWIDGSYVQGDPPYSTKATRKVIKACLA